MPKDFTTINGRIGIRIYDDGSCGVIERKPGVHGWVEEGQRFRLPLPDGFDSTTTIPVSRLALAFRAYEIEYPGSGLREVLTKKPAV